MNTTVRNQRLVSEENLKRELDGLVTQMHTSGVSYADAVRQFKRRYILEVLAHHKGNQCKAADELGMHRNTLSRTLSELDLDTTQIRMQIRDQVRDQIRNGMRRPPSSERPRVQNIADAR
jgi:Fis family transcriptional regulator, factor for inversion stimulation protein